MAKTRIAREIDEILATPKARQGATEASARGEDAYKNIQSEARGAESEARMADHAAAVTAQQGPWPAHSLVGLSEQHAEQAAKIVAHAQGWVREARGTPQSAAVERVLASVRGSAARAKAHAASTKRAFEARFGKYDPRGLRSAAPKNHATVKNRQSSQRKGESTLGTRERDPVVNATPKQILALLNELESRIHELDNTELNLRRDCEIALGMAVARPESVQRSVRNVSAYLASKNRHASGTPLSPPATDAQIRKLRNEASDSDDTAQVVICALALNGLEDRADYDTPVSNTRVAVDYYNARPRDLPRDFDSWTPERARIECARIIDRARAQEE